jgi:hypothetical protein
MEIDEVVRKKQLEEVELVEEISTESNEDEYEIDPAYEQFLQNEFQDEVVDTIFYQIADYIKNQAIPLCEHLTREDIEIIIENLI